MRLHYGYDVDEVRVMPWWKVAMYLEGLIELNEEMEDRAAGDDDYDTPYPTPDEQRPSQGWVGQGKQVEASAEALRSYGFNVQTFGDSN